MGKRLSDQLTGQTKGIPGILLLPDLEKDKTNQIPRSPEPQQRPDNNRVDEVYKEPSHWLFPDTKAMPRFRGRVSDMAAVAEGQRVDETKVTITECNL